MTIGIDLGTTNSLMAYIDDDQPTLIPNSRGMLRTPSVVGVDRTGTVLVGVAAANQALTHPDRTVVAIKRDMGLRKTVTVGAHRLSPEEVSAAILRVLRENASSFIGEEQTSAVITVPAHFDDHQRFSTYEAALLAGFDKVALLNEPTAAALPYAARERTHERIVVFDFGGGTLDITALERSGAEFTVRATVGDGRLGGIDIDGVVAQFILERITQQFGSHMTENPQVQRVAHQLAEQAKIDLSEMEETEVTMPFLVPGEHPAHLNVVLERREFDSLIQAYVDRARALTRDAVREGGFEKSGFDRLVLAGGSSRIPAVRSMLHEEFGAETASRINPEEVIATGAAMFAARRDGSHETFSLRDVLSGTLAIELADGSCVPLVRKNQTLPVRQSRLFTTVSDNQPEAEIHLVQGNHHQAWKNRSLGRFILRDIRDAPQGAPRIAVTINVSGDGIVTVRAGDRDTGAWEEMVAQARPEPTTQTINGGRAEYAQSLVRRSRRVRRFAEPGLREELDEILSIMEEGYHAAGEDMITVLETLLREVVLSTTISRQQQERHDAAS
ncbi:MAG: Hsp70 family protein [Alkalispirochaeta sp.]